MHSLCLLESVSRSDGGIFEAELALQKELVTGQGIRVDVVGLEDIYTKEDLHKWHPITPQAILPLGPAALGYSPDLLPALDPKADLLYAATLWKYPSMAALKWSERTKKPMIVAPHGSLDPWALRNAAWKKRLVSALFKDRQLHKATCLRALCQSEAEAIRSYGLTNPIAIIPNGVLIPEMPESRDEGRGTSAPKKLLFLGRIHPKKGLTNFIRGFKKSLDPRRSTLDSSWQLIIAGWDQGGHERELMQLCEELGLKSEKLKVEGGRRALDARPSTLDSEVIFYGPAFGKEKEDLLCSADAFVLPSFSEGLPMSVLEAWAYGLPVIMTPECNLPEGFLADSAIRIETGVESIADGLETLFSIREGDLRAMGLNGRELVQERFTWRTIAAQVKEVYDWMLGGGSLPECIRFN